MEMVRGHVLVCGGTGCTSSGSEAIINEMEAQLKEKGLPIDISLENTVLTYTNPVIKVLIDDNSNIVKGTWSCTVEISLSDYKFAGSAVDSTVVVLNNKIVVNGGFNP